VRLPRWRRRRAGGVAAAPAGPGEAELARAARLLLLRSRRAAAGTLSGAWLGAYRAGGLEFEELRPYVPGDDVRALDWNATARTGAPVVRRFREERDRALLLVLDASASMRFGTAGASGAGQAAHAAALLASAAGRARDRIGLVVFDDDVRCEIPPARGPLQTGRVIRSLLSAGCHASGGTGLGRALGRVRRHVRRGAVVCLLSDFRSGADAGDALLAELGRRHDLVSIVLHDPRDDALPPAGRVRFADPERRGATLWLDTASGRVREHYRVAAAARRRALAGRLRAAGSDVLWLRSGVPPLGPLLQFLTDRAARGRGAP